MRLHVAADDRPAGHVDGIGAEVGDFEPLRVALAGGHLGVEHHFIDHDGLLARSEAPRRRSRGAEVSGDPRQRRGTPVLAEAVVEAGVAQRHRRAVGVREGLAVVPANAVELHEVAVGDHQLVGVVLQHHVAAVRVVGLQATVGARLVGEQRVALRRHDDGSRHREAVVVVILDREAGHVDRLVVGVVDLEVLTAIVGGQPGVLHDLGDHQMLCRRLATVRRAGAAEIPATHDRHGRAPVGALVVVGFRIRQGHARALRHVEPGGPIDAVAYGATRRRARSADRSSRTARSRCRRRSAATRHRSRTSRPRGQERGTDRQRCRSTERRIDRCRRRRGSNRAGWRADRLRCRARSTHRGSRRPCGDRPSAR